MKGKQQKQNVVYLLSNPGMDGQFKVGISNEIKLDNRVKLLYTTGVPEPFVLEYAVLRDDARKVERNILKVFAPDKKNERREFLKTDMERILAVFELLGEDISERYESSNKVVKDKESVQTKKKKPPFNFIKMGIPLDGELTSRDNEDICVVREGNTVEYKGEIVSLSTAARLSNNWKRNRQPTHYWLYKGSLLIDLYNNVQLKK